MTPVVTSSSPIQLSCPRCRVPLRMRLRPGDARTFDCPECRAPLEVVERDGVIMLQPSKPVVQPAGRSVATSITFAAPFQASQRWWTRTRSFIASRSSDPLFVTWTVAGIAAVGIAVAFWQTSEEPAPLAARPSEQTDELQKARPVRQEVAKSDVPTVPLEPVEAPRQTIVLLQPVEVTKPLRAPPPDPRELIAASLSRRVLKFEQPTPVPFEQLRFQIEEMIGFPIEYGFVGAEERGGEPVVVSLANVTMEELLMEVAARARLQINITDTGIRLTPMGTPPDAVSDARVNP